MGFLSSSREGKRRRVRKAPRARIRKMRKRCTGVRLGNNIFLFYRMFVNIILSKRKLMDGCALFFRKKLVFNNEPLLVS